MKILVDHHLGMGDMIIHNGMVRKISIDHPQSEIYILCKPHYFENVKYMYRDNKRIKILILGETHFNDLKFDFKISAYISNNQYGLYFDDAFYITVNMDPEIKTKYFYVERDETIENQVFEELVTSKGITDYIFLHEKEESGIRIDRSRISTQIPIISAPKNYGIFHLLKVIENAKSVELICSSFLSLMTCKKYNRNTIAHMYCDRGEISSYVKKHGIEVLQ